MRQLEGLFATKLFVFKKLVFLVGDFTFAARTI